ncbi:hypothetical protein D9M69_514230 [compost metagenome]
MRVGPAQREVFGQSFGHKQRNVPHVLEAGGVTSVGHGLVLEYVYHFVAEHVVCLAFRKKQGHHHPGLEALGYSAGTLTDPAADHGGFLEVGMRIVDDQRVGVNKRHLEDLLVIFIPVLAVSEQVIGQGLVIQVIVQIEMTAPEHFKLIGAVPGFVLPEIFALSGCLKGRKDQADHKKLNFSGHNVRSWVWWLLQI